MSSVEVSNVYKAYGAQDVIHGVDIKIDHGEFVALVGPSGCGKSTLLRMIAGLEKITEGAILIDDQVVNKVPAKQRDIAMVFQSYALYPQMTVAQNLGFALKLKGVPRKDIQARVAEAAKVLDLTKLLHRKPRQLSGGQRQRVAMGRAIVRDPKVFLFDEPLSNLDAKLRVAMRAEIKSLHHRLGSTILYVTHDQIEAMTMADKIVVMRDGRIEQIGAPLDLYDRPANRFVAGFIGSPAMNFVEGTFVDGGAPCLRMADERAVRLSKGPEGSHNKQVLFGLRPEHVQVTATGEGVTGTVLLVEPTGAETYLLVDIGGHHLVSVTSERSGLAVGDTVRVDLSHPAGHFFDPASGDRLPS